MSRARTSRMKQVSWLGRGLRGTGVAGLAVALGALGVLAWRLRPGASLEGQVVLVTGGSRGLGFLIARRLLREGCAVVICGRDPETLDRAVARLEAEMVGRDAAGNGAGGAPPSRTGGARVAGWPCDVRDREAVRELVDRIRDRFGLVDIVVNNAGVIQVGPVRTMELEDFRTALDTDFWGALHTVEAVLPQMRARRFGRIANITSIASHVAVPHLLPYVVAKHAKLGLSDGLAAELSSYGVSVTTVVPGLMRTGSPVHVDFRGQPEREYAWFVLGSVNPLSTMSAERAARRIVRAMRRRERRVTLSWQARTLRLAHDLAPGAAVRAIGWVNRLFPDAGRDGRPVDSAPGTALRGTLPAPVEWALDRLAARSNQ